ncbi:L-type lectin-domain containing receptor kinase IV.4-like [Miscanthus floridulus]|uniref:L-type lectin-domain containing receptor kinase IV.4-like n=1 Tax=Miscanthus floridulus TaxID=154761 RepID=UPI003459292F
MSTGATTRSGLLQLTNGTAYRLKLKGHAFHPTPLQLRDSPNGSVQSFSVAFVVRIVTVSPGKGLVLCSLPAKNLGLANIQNNGNASNHLLAVELDTIQSVEFKDTNANVGIDINGLQSLRSYNAASMCACVGASPMKMSTREQIRESVVGRGD